MKNSFLHKSCILFLSMLAVFFIAFISGQKNEPYMQIELFSDKASTAQVFYSPNRVFAEKLSSKVSLQTGKQSLYFSVKTKDPSKIKYFRFDPTTVSANLLMLKAVTWYDGKKYYQADLQKRAFVKTEFLKVNDQHSPEGIWMTSSGADPRIILSVADFLPVKSSFFDLRTVTALKYAGIAGCIILCFYLFAFLKSCYKNRTGFYYFLCSIRQWKSFRCGAILCGGLLVAVAAVQYFSPAPRCELELDADHPPLIQVFYGIHGVFSSKRSSLLWGKNSNNEYSFVFPEEYVRQISSIRFDPTHLEDSIIKIRKFTLVTDKKIYTLPLKDIKTFRYSGIEFTDVQENCITGKVLNNDPQIQIPLSSMTVTAKKSFFAAGGYVIAVIGFLLGAALTFCIISGGKLRKAVFLFLGVAVCCLTLKTLLQQTEYLGKFTAVILVLCIIKCIVILLLEKTHVLQPEPEKKVKANFDWSMHYFRAFAISCICVGHMYGVMNIMTHYKFFVSDSIYFLFISGYLCQYLFDKKPESPFSYYKKKILNVILPYLIISLTVIFLQLYVMHSSDASLYAGDKSADSIFHALLYGGAVSCYWYIPFVAILFLVSPLLCRMKPEHFFKYLLISAVVFIVFPKRGSWNTWQDGICLYTYFTFSYLFGMVFSRYRETLQKSFNWMFLPALLMGIALIYLIKNDTFPLLLSETNTLQAIQKYCFIIAILPLLEKIRDKKIYLLDKLAVYSFTIFFLHMIFCQDFGQLWLYFTKNYAFLVKAQFEDGIAIHFFAPLAGTGYLLIMLALSMMLKKILGKYSRYIIGS